MHSRDTLISDDVTPVLVITICVNVRTDWLTKVPCDDVAAVLRGEVLAASHHREQSVLQVMSDLVCI